jgi:hypothetical protein
LRPNGAGWPRKSIPIANKHTNLKPQRGSEKRMIERDKSAAPERSDWNEKIIANGEH